MSALGFVLIVTALALLLISTRQWPLLFRGLAWSTGVLVLVVAGFVVVGSSDSGLLRAFGDLWVNAGDGVLARSLERNGPSLGRFLFPLLDVFLLLAAAVAVLCLIAFSPGELIEKVSRPIIVGLVGAGFGALFALAVVGTGFGAAWEQRTFATHMTSNEVIDGDTLWIGEIQLRLEGIDAPERRQQCRRARRLVECGRSATRHLQTLVNGALVLCEASGERRRSDDVFGRPLVVCSVTDELGEIDLGEAMVRAGYAFAHRETGGRYVSAEEQARAERLGLWSACTLRPDVWRRNRTARVAFIEGRRPGEGLLSGSCPGEFPPPSASPPPRGSRAPD